MLNSAYVLGGDFAVSVGLSLMSNIVIILL